MVGPQALRGVARDLGFAEFGVGECDGKSMNAFLHVAGERGDGGGIQAAAEKHADGNVRDEMAADGIFQQRTNGGGGGGKILLVGSSGFGFLVLIKFLDEIPVEFWLGDAARVVRADFYEMSWRQGEDAFDHRHRFADGTKQQVRRNRGSGKLRRNAAAG